MKTQAQYVSIKDFLSRVVEKLEDGTARFIKYTEIREVEKEMVKARQVINMMDEEEEEEEELG